jgi:hypothetical protein
VYQQEHLVSHDRRQARAPQSGPNPVPVLGPLGLHLRGRGMFMKEL